MNWKQLIETNILEHPKKVRLKMRFIINPQSDKSDWDRVFVREVHSTPSKVYTISSVIADNMLFFDSGWQVSDGFLKTHFHYIGD